MFIDRFHLLYCDIYISCNNLWFVFDHYQEKLRLVDKWLIYEGDIEGHSAAKISSKKPIFCVRKHQKMLQGNLKVLAHVYKGISDRRLVYVIEGSYVHRSCKVYDESRRMVVAEIKKKQPMVSHGGVCISFGLEVFVLVVRQGFDSGFAMAMVLLLDQMFS